MTEILGTEFARSLVGEQKGVRKTVALFRGSIEGEVGCSVAEGARGGGSAAEAPHNAARPLTPRGDQKQRKEDDVCVHDINNYELYARTINGDVSNKYSKFG